MARLVPDPLLHHRSLHDGCSTNHRRLFLTSSSSIAAEKWGSDAVFLFAPITEGEKKIKTIQCIHEWVMCMATAPDVSHDRWPPARQLRYQIKAANSAAQMQVSVILPIHHELFGSGLLAGRMHSQTSAATSVHAKHRTWSQAHLRLAVRFAVWLAGRL
jgi:hypothetical protein